MRVNFFLTQTLSYKFCLLFLTSYLQFTYHQSSTSKPNYETPEYEDDEDEPTSGKVEIIENGNNIQNNGLNWNQPSWNQPWVCI